jgi:hypothetical protein
MKLQKVVRNAVLATAAWKLLQKRTQSRTHTRRRTQVSYAGGILFAAGAGVAFLFREQIAQFLGNLRAEPYVPIAGNYDPPPPSRKKQQALERREAAEKRAREQQAHKPAVVRVEKNANPDLAVPLRDALKH